MPAPGSADRLAAALAQLRERTSVAAAAPVAIPAVAPTPAEPRPPSRVAQRVGAKLAHLFDAVTDAAIESLPGRLRRTPGEADESDLEDFEKAAAEIVQRWIPDAALGPYGNLVLAAVYVVGGKWVDGEPHAITVPVRAAAPAAATNTTVPNQPVTSAAPTAAPPVVAPAPLPSGAGGF